jgi:hypothetical protein
MTDERTSRVAELLSETASAHHTFEQEELGGERDEQWARWYADRALEHGLADALGSAPSAEQIAGVLTEATADHEREGAEVEWSEYAAGRVVERLG